jgi:uncharacterized RDD family membrane protein YckC
MSDTTGLLGTDDLVTGEAVALDLPPATVGARTGSCLIDIASTLTLGTVVFFLAILATLDADAALQHVAFVCSLVLVFVVYPTTVETLTRGKSLGKLLLGLRVVRDDGGTVTAQQSFVRALIGVVEIYALSGVPAFFSSLLSSRGKRIGDYAAGTYVVRDRADLRLPPPPVMPAGLVAWATAADLSPPPVGLSLAVRQYLGRLPVLDPASRDRLGSMLAEQMSAYVAPPPPPGTTSWDYLAAVSASRRERDMARLHREESLRVRLSPRRR